MKKSFNLLPFLALIFLSFQSSEPPFRVVEKSFSQNEVLEYKVSYGFISAGMTRVEIDSQIYSINNRPCYKIEVNGRTTGAFDMIAKINDYLGAYVDTAALIPHISYRKLSEGGYRKHEIVKFDHKTSFLENKTYDFKNKVFKEPKYYLFPANVQDIISGFYYLRSLDFDTIAKKDTIVFNTFFEDKIYEFQILYEGKEVVKTDFGNINAHVLKPVMPDNKVFAGENSITCWLSDDENKIPLKIKASLFIGSAEVSLEKAENLKSTLVILKENN